MKPLHVKILLTASILLGLAVMLGAFGAHGLEAKLAPKQINTFKTGVTYHFYHGIALFMLGLTQKLFPQMKLKKSFIYFTLGILLFSGNCYIYAITNIKTFALIIPLGGILFIFGWLTLAFSFYKEPK